MSAPLPSRHAPFLQPQGPRVPSLPIPIPSRRVGTNPPPRSPERELSSSDMVFEMSPVALDEAPVKHLNVPSFSSAGDAYQRPYVPFSRLNVHTGGAVDASQPYAREPFLYSIPKLSTRKSLSHKKSRSEIVSPTHIGRQQAPLAASVHYAVDPRTSSLSSTVPAHGDQMDDAAYSSYQVPIGLTEAFQNSVSSGTSLTASSFLPSPADSERALSAQDASSFLLSNELASAKSRDGNIKAAYHPNGISRTSAAAPVLSFAQVELESTGFFARETRVGRGKPKSPPCSTLVARARSPYALARGRRNSILRERSMRFSDDDISGTLKHDKPYEKFGLEKYLPAGMQKRNPNPKDENIINDVFAEKERGRTRSRARGGIRS